MKIYRTCKLLFSLSLIFTGQIVIAKDKNIVYVYNDAGSSQTSLLQTIHTFKSILPSSFKIKTINAKAVIQNDWSHDAALFIMPGGADLPYVKKLNGAGNANIKHYVKNGGSYLGLCAGAYYASLTIEFDKGGPLEVLGDRELAFFKGKSIGPILSKFDYKTESSARAATVTLPSSNVKEMTVYYNGGGYFQNAENVKQVNVMGYYSDHKPAIISMRYAKGYVVLSGVHFEYNPLLLDGKNSFLVKMIPQLIAANNNRLAFFSEVLKKLHVDA